MKDYFIRGQVKAGKANNDSKGAKTCVDVSYNSPQELVGLLRVEVWDKDIRFDDRLGSAKTDSEGYFEIRFTEEDFRQDYLDLDREPEIFFQVFRGANLLFRTSVEDSENIDWQGTDNPYILPFPDQQNPGYLVSDICYKIHITKAEAKEGQSESRQPEKLPEDTVSVVDILPTSDQIGSISQPTASFESRSGSLQQILDSALSEVLGRNVQANDPKVILNTLTQTFSPQVTNGRTTYVWTPRTYSTAQTELGGAVSGAQASLYHRAKAASNDALGLLEKLYPLEPAADEQNIEAIRSIVRTEINELVEEMAAPGGPRPQRVENLFQLLLGDGNNSDPFDKVGGQIKILAEVFGLVRSRINTVDEERNYSNYLIVKDYLVSLRGSWNAYIQNSGAGAFVGTQLVLLSQALSVVAESAEEVNRIMDLVFLGPAERQAVYIDFTKARDSNLNPRRSKGKEIEEVEGKQVAFLLPDGTPYSVEETLQLVPPMSVAGLLTWALRFGAEEGPALARAGGKLGIANAIAGTATKLMILAQAAAYAPVPNTAFRREGVRRALRDLAFQLYQVKRLAEEIIPPPPPYGVDDIDSFSSGTSRSSFSSLSGPKRRA